MADPYLIGIAQAAERGEPLPRIRLFAGGSAAIGQPTSTADYLELSELSQREEWEAYLRNRPRKDRREEPGDPVEWARRNLATIRQVDATGTPEAINLRNAQWYPISGSGGVDLPTIRVPIAAIDAWWVTGGQQIKGPSGGGWFFGVAVPLDVGE